MDNWLTVDEVAELQGQSERTVRWQAKEGKYTTRMEKNVLGGGAGGMIVRIALTSLPPEVQVEYMRRHGMIRDITLSGESDGFDLAPDWKRDVAAKRLGIIRAADLYLARRHGVNKTEALKEFAESWNATHDGERVSDKTIYRWKKFLREYGRCGLLPDWGKREARTSIDPRALEYFKKLYFNQNQPSVRSCRRDLVDACTENGWRIPTIDALERFVAGMPKAALTLAREGPEAFRNKCAPYIERDPESIAGNQIWVSDHYEFDVMVKGPNGKPVRPWLTAWVDMRSFKMVSHHVGYSPSTDTIMAAFADGALDKTIGLPREIYTDNGRDYCSKEFAGTGHRRTAKSQEDDDRRVRTLVETLDITPHFAIPKNARAKIAERVFRVVAENFCKSFSTYCGSNSSKKPEQLKEILKDPNQLPDFKEFQRQFAQWARLVYNKMESAGKGRKGECPDETFERTRGPIRLASLAEMRLCLMRHSQPVKVGRHGVTLFGQHYYDTELIRYLGESVFLRYRDEDMTQVHVCDLKDRLLCTATLKTMLPSVRADKEDIRKAKTEEKRAQRITKEYLEINEEIAAMPSSLDRVLAKKQQKVDQSPVTRPKVAEMLQLGRNIKEAAEQLSTARAVGQNTARISSLIQQAGSVVQPVEERRIKASDVLRILNKPQK